MGLFDFFKKEQPSAPTSALDSQTIFFQDGQLYKVAGKDEKYWYDADILVSDGVTYNLRSTEDIRSIKIPNFKTANSFSGYGVTGSLDYVLRMKAGAYFNRKEKELCSACLWKSTELMLSHKFWWKKHDFERIINWHYDLGMISEAEKAAAWLSEQAVYTENEFDQYAKSILESTMKNAARYSYDLVVFNDYGDGCCEECAKLRGRVYSISGNHKIFPALPGYVREHGNFHPGCRCTMSIYFGVESVYLAGNEIDAIETSTRPWEDNRTDREKALYQEYVDRSNKSVEEAAQREKDRAEYQKLLQTMPDLAPKSFSAYRRMKNSNSTKFQELIETAKVKGFKIEL